MPKKTVVTIGDKVHKLRTDLGLTQFDLAIKSGLRETTISKIERGKCNASLASLHKLAGPLGTTIDALVSSLPTAQTKAAGGRQQAAEGKRKT